MIDSALKKFGSSKTVEKFKQKRWQYLCIANQDFLFSCALVDVAYAGNVFFFFADLPGRQVYFDQTFLCLPGYHLKINDQPLVGAQVSFKKGQTSLDLTHPLNGSGFNFSLKAGDLQINAQLKTQNAPEPLCLQVHENSKLRAYTQKTTMLPVQGELQFKGKAFNLEGALAGLDYTNGVLPRVTQWCWAFALGKLEDGTGLSFNISAGNHLGGKSENCIWIDGQRFDLPRVVFRFDPSNPRGSWKIDSADGSVALQFQPSGEHREDRNLLLIRSHFVQVCGIYSGTFRLPHVSGGRVVQFSGLPGIAEDQDVKW